MYALVFLEINPRLKRSNQVRIFLIACAFEQKFLEMSFQKISKVFPH
jgi:thiaminase